MNCEVYQSDAAPHALLVTSSTDIVELRAHVMTCLLAIEKPYRRVELRVTPSGVLVLFQGGYLSREQVLEALRCPLE